MVMLKIQQTDAFDTWYNGLRDIRAKSAITSRVDRLALGNPGDVKPVGGGVSELRIAYGPGYRVYFRMQGQTIILLLCGGDKSTQAKDIVRAKSLATQSKDAP